MGGKQGEMARKLAIAKQQRASAASASTSSGSEQQQQQQQSDDTNMNMSYQAEVNDDTLDEETRKLKREFDYMLQNNAYTINPNEYESEEEMLADYDPNSSASSDSSTENSSKKSQARRNLPPLLYVSDPFPFTPSTLSPYLFTPSSLPSSPPLSSSYTTYIIDPRPTSSFFTQTLNSLITSFKTLPTSSSYVLITSSTPGTLRQNIKKISKPLGSKILPDLIDKGTITQSNSLSILTTDGGIEKDGSRKSVKNISSNEVFLKTGTSGSGRILSLSIIIVDSKGIIKYVKNGCDGLIDYGWVKDILGGL
ncbi:hypothetical protein TrVE_jg6458 [Triparma verrucosa]|uniref:Uncharacterized protein n=1 Tax=Triparma verrucosa TaxID=1606542 RepID=A0A9W7BXI1_9STRA|nr:hypothetical protein TrVE_jg6458 [Triparma verrucosa]